MKLFSKASILELLIRMCKFRDAPSISRTRIKVSKQIQDSNEIVNLICKNGAFNHMQLVCMSHALPKFLLTTPLIHILEPAQPKFKIACSCHISCSL